MNNVFSKRIKSARILSGLSLQEVSDKLAGIVTKQALNKYEAGTALPDSQMLISLSKIFAVNIEYFFRPEKYLLDLAMPAFRKKSSISEKKINSTMEKTKEYLERYLEAEELFPPERYKHYFFKKTPINTMDDVEESAKILRTEWDLGSDPIENMVQNLEDRNIKVIITQLPEGMDGFTSTANKNINFIVVKEGLPGDRQRSNLAHELGHIVMDVTPSLDEEKCAKRFSGAFLVPKETVLQELGSTRHNLTYPELQNLKKKYGMSMQQWLYRAKDLNIISDTHFKSWMIRFRRSGCKKEPGIEINEESSNRMEQIVFQALEEDLISESKAAELLNLSIIDVRNKMRIPF